jgi:hypothetical protein
MMNEGLWPEIAPTGIDDCCGLVYGFGEIEDRLN